MATPQPAPESSLQVRRLFAASREKVFRAWTERAALEQWMCRTNPASTTRYLDLDVRPGGKHHLEIRNPNGDVYVQVGTFREIRPYDKIVFTWSWEQTPQGKAKPEEIVETLVTVEFFERGNQTEVLLTHERFPSAPMRDMHQQGWNACFDALEKVLQTLGNN
ncbi:MAG TPA: SRPBCC domain-containing protein [Candidatus Acidoferrum sp.]|nr:SRPBCC domain-containing protein [Candidatus Acidoferrum sp.]